jgi:hypothetical protein
MIPVVVRLKMPVPHISTNCSSIYCVICYELPYVICSLSAMTVDNSVVSCIRKRHISDILI